jgi:hypothetical protein
MKEIRTEIVIEAPRAQVWKTLMDFEKYGHWNPFIVSIEGKAIKGGKLRNTMRQGKKDQVFKPQIMELIPEKRFEWLGKLPLGAFTGRHYFILEDAGVGRTKLTHGEHFGGWLRKMIMNKIGEQTQNSFIAMNRALAEEVARVAKVPAARP